MTVFQGIVTVGAAFPWETVVGGLRSRSRRETGVQKDATLEQPMGNPAEGSFERPGCTAADETLTVKGHLDGLAGGLGGFGLLRSSKERLENAAAGAQKAGDAATSARLRVIAGKLPDVHTPDQAAAVANELDDIVPVVWELGKRCKGAISQDTMDAARDLAEQVNQGNISREAAVEQLRLANETS